MKNMNLIAMILSFSVIAYPAHAVDIDAYGASSATPGDRVNRGRGHDRDKEPILSGDVINGLYGRGYNGSAFTTSDGVSIEMQASQDWTTTANGTKILIKTTPAGSTTAATVGTFQSDGGFLPFSRTEAQLKVSTPTATGAIYYDSTNKEFVQSTGTTTCLDYGKIEAAATAPDGW